MAVNSALSEVYVAIWRVPNEGDALIGVFTTLEEAEEAADADIYCNTRGESEGIVELWPLDRAIDLNAGDLPLAKWLPAAPEKENTDA